MLRLCAVILASFIAVAVNGYKMYQDKIPNGEGVPHPCVANHIWHGVGHKNVLGGGDRNPFGIAFAANGYKWDATLCNEDSDGDGKTNGEELGDPDCTWSEGTSPKTFKGLSHPGVCEPLDAANCKARNDWEFCQQKGFECAGTGEQGVKDITISMTKTAVPATETNYYCQLIDLPADDDFHIIADMPALDNEDVIHHMLLFGCPNSEKLEKYRTPQPCGMQSQGLCPGQIAGWTVGSPGRCLDGIDAGVRMGKNSFKQALLQVHWNNPLHRKDYLDGSGITLYYTSKLRKYDMGNLVVGQLGLLLPPGRTELSATSVCKGSCTRKHLPNSVNITSVGLHMHYTGRGGSLDVYREGKKVKTLADEPKYSYDNPKDYIQNPPFVLMPGDEIRTKCNFKTTARNDIIYYGDGTSDEMCFGFIQYYPDVEFNSCIHFDTTELCNRDPSKDSEDLRYVGECDYKDTAGITALRGKVARNCDATGKECLDTCLKLFTEDPDPCLQRAPKLFSEFAFSRVLPSMNFVKASRSCDSIIYGFEVDKTNSAPTLSFPGLLLLPFLLIFLSGIKNICYG